MFQLERDQDQKVSAISSSVIREALESVFPSGKITVKIEQFDGETFDGDGCLFLAFWAGGSSMILWDGRNHIDMNLFTDVESNEFATKFVDTFVKKKLSDFEIKLHDEQPRGIGRVVNFEEDVGTFDESDPDDYDPHWAETIIN